MSPALLFGILLSGVLLAWLVVAFAFRDILLRLWREPIVRHPVLIIESDDWGPGPDGHVQALVAVCDLLRRHRDAEGRPAVMTVGVVLAVPDNNAIRKSGFRIYARKTLLDEAYTGMRNALVRGWSDRVLALQIHGLEHLWPPTFMQTSVGDEALRRWMESGDGTETESLPAHIQSRWADVSVLPSRALSVLEINTAVDAEVQLYQECFGEKPSVVVPPTFIWNETVEKAWSRNAVKTVITPGRRFTGRDGGGMPALIDRLVYNGESAADGMTYLVRDIYFEPVYGHTAGKAVEDIVERYQLGRPALLETHRFNFIGGGDRLQNSLKELDRLLSLGLQRLPSLRFMSSEELAEQFMQRHCGLLEQRLAVRTLVWLRRAAQIGRLRKLAWITGLALPVGLFLLALMQGTAKYENAKQESAI